MGTTWAVIGTANGQPTRLGTELATAARALARDGASAAGLVIGPDAETAAPLAAAYLSRVVAGTQPAGTPWVVVAARLVLERVDLAHDVLLVGADPDGLALAGMLVGITDAPILVAATGLAHTEDGPLVRMQPFGGRLRTTSAFQGPAAGIIVVRPGSTPPQPATSTGMVEATEPVADDRLAPVTIEVLSIDTGEGSAGQSIEEARIVVGGGRGVGGPDGFRMLDELATLLGGAVGATRAAVDAGWIGYDQQIGQTGKSIRPDLYLACGISGAIQHKVGVQAVGSVVAIDRDPDAPIREFADLFVVGDLHLVVPALIERLRG